MTPQEALHKSYEICAAQGLKDIESIRVDNFLEYSQLVLDIVKSWTPKQRDAYSPWSTGFLRGFLTLRDDFEAEVRRDPMILYKPKHEVSLAFHKSNAFIRYYRAGNRTSKTQSGYAEHYMIVTGQTKYRDYGPYQPELTFIIAGLPFTVYAPQIFEKKFLYGEPGNPISPMFPEGGKWFNHYDARTRTITIACKDCAEAGKAASCRHQRSKILLVSSELGTGVIEAFKAKLCHIDEHVPEDFFAAAQQRIIDTPKSAMIVTATPYLGMDTWEQKRLAEVAEGPAILNKADPDDPRSPPFCDLFQIDQFKAGISEHYQIRRAMSRMDDFEVEARIYGRPAALAKNPVFDRRKLAELRKSATQPRLFVSGTRGGIDLLEVVSSEADPANSQIELEEQFIPEENLKQWTGIRVWELPERNACYIAGIDTASGLRQSGDASVCSIVKVSPEGMSLRLDLVAQFWGWLNTFEYGREVFKLCVAYNDALAVVETTGGYGDAVMQVLKDQIAYWNIFRDRTTVIQATHALDGRLGVDTNRTTKPLMIASLQQFLKEDKVGIPCLETIEEMARYEQEMTSTTGAKLQAPRFQGAGGSKDDRVMSMCMAAGVAITNAAQLPLALPQYGDSQ